MTTLVLPESRSEASIGSTTAIGLREWLAGHWAILFSHPGDFDREQLERDRWLSVLSRNFSAQGVRVLALARNGYDAGRVSHGWLTELGDGCAAVLSTIAPVPDALLDLRASALRAEIARSGPRFAMIIDSDLNRRRTMHYRVALDLPSPVEIAGWVGALRKRQPLTSPYPDDVIASEARRFGARTSAASLTARGHRSDRRSRYR